MKWVVPYCGNQTDGPAWPATGFPLPYEVFGGASSLQYIFMPHFYLVDLAVYAGVLFLALRYFRPTSSRLKRVASLGGVASFLLVTAGLLLAMKDLVLIPVFTIGDDSYAPYLEYRPVGLSLSHHPEQCQGSEFWFPDGWKNR